MKKYLLILAAISFSAISLSAQNNAAGDWAQFGRYAAANSEVDEKPYAVLMGDSITDAWDGKDNQGKPVPAGTYTVFLEGTLYWNTRVLYSAKVQWGNGNAGQAPVTVHKTGTSERNQNMIANVRFSHTTTKP